MNQTKQIAAAAPIKPSNEKVTSLALEYIAAAEAKRTAQAVLDAAEARLAKAITAAGISLTSGNMNETGRRVSRIVSKHFDEQARS